MESRPRESVLARRAVLLGVVALVLMAVQVGSFPYLMGAFFPEGDSIEGDEFFRRMRWVSGISGFLSLVGLVCSLTGLGYTIVATLRKPRSRLLAVAWAVNLVGSGVAPFLYVVPTVG